MTTDPQREAEGVDVVHLSPKPPFVPGSNNRTTAAFIAWGARHGLRQKMISYWDGAPPDGDAHALPWRPHTVLVGREEVGGWRRSYLRLPERVRKGLFHRMGDAERQAYVWRLGEVLPRLRPKVIVTYDGHWAGSLLRPQLTWPCRLVLSQRGLSYRFAPDAAHQIYSLASFDAVWSLSRASYRVDRARMLGYEPVVTVIPNCVDADRFRPVSTEQRRTLRAAWGLPERSRVVLVLGRLVPRKGAHLLVQSWPRVLAAHPDALLWLVGDGEPGYLRYLEGLVAALGLEAAVRFQGHVPGDETERCYGAADVYAFPTLASEGMSLALLEALASGLPSVASAHDVGCEHHTHGEVLFVPDPNLQDAFVEPLVRVLGDPALQEALGQAARRAAVDYFSYHVIFPRLAAFLKSQMALAGAGGADLTHPLSE